MAVFGDLPPEILEKILQYVSSGEDIMSFRQVSKYCRNSTLPIWNKYQFATITDLVGGNLMTRFLQLVDTGENVKIGQPFVNFILFGEFAGNNFGSLEQFLIKCGPQIKSLNLKHCSIPSVWCLEQLVFQACINLSELTYSEPITQYPWRNPNVQFPRFQDFSAPIENRNLSRLTIVHPGGSNNDLAFFVDLFKRIPCLKSLQLQHCTDRALSEIFRAIDIVRKEDPSRFKLTEILFDRNLVDKRPCEVMQILTDPGLNLKIINVHLEVSTQLNEIIQRHASSLKKLEVFVHPKSELDPLLKRDISYLKTFDILENLTVLKMNDDMSMVPLILKCAPNLKILSLHCDPKSVAYLFSGSYTRDALTDLQLTKCTELEMNQYLSSAQMLILINCIPNVKKLKMPLDDASFAEICKRWSNLTSLEAPLSKISEAGVTGLDERDIQIINAAGENGCVRPASVPRANISAMKYLQSFVICSPPYEMEQHPPALRGMSYCSIKYGFQQVPSLQNVRVQHMEVNGDFWETLPQRWRKPKYLVPS